MEMEMENYPISNYVHLNVFEIVIMQQAAIVILPFSPRKYQQKFTPNSLHNVNQCRFKIRDKPKSI